MKFVDPDGEDIHLVRTFNFITKYYEVKVYQLTPLARQFDGLLINYKTTYLGDLSYDYDYDTGVIRYFVGDPNEYNSLENIVHKDFSDELATKGVLTLVDVGLNISDIIIGGSKDIIEYAIKLIPSSKTDYFKLLINAKLSTNGVRDSEGIGNLLTINGSKENTGDMTSILPVSSWFSAFHFSAYNSTNQLDKMPNLHNANYIQDAPKLDDNWFFSNINKKKENNE